MALDKDLFLYDGDCGFCARSVAWLSGRTDGSVTFTPWQRADIDALGVSAADLEKQAVLVTTDGRRFDGHLAFGESLRRSPQRDTNLLGRLILEQPTREVSRWVYGWVAKNRHRLGGPAACSVPQ